MQLTLLLPIVVALSFVSGEAPDTRRGDPNFDSLSGPIRRAVARMTHPELDRRRHLLRSMQRHGYAATVQDIVEGDFLSALLVSLRTSVQVEFHLPHTPIVVFIPVVQPKRHDSHLPGFTGAPSPPLAVVLPEDRSFPRDPWERSSADSVNGRPQVPVP